MREIKKLITILFMLFIGLVIYFNYGKITEFFKKYIKEENTVIIPESNTYKRNYRYQRFKNDDDFTPHSISDMENIFYNILNNGWEKFVFYCPKDYETCIEDAEKIANDKPLMSKIAGYVSPYNTHSLIKISISSYGIIYVEVAKKYSDNEIQEINNKIQEIYALLELDSKPIEEKIKLFHDYVADNTVYDEEFAENKKSIYRSSKASGALIEGHAVCGGYADTLAIFLDYINVPNIIISNQNHAWNLVYYNNEWVHIDPTWNDTEIERYDYEYYMICGKSCSMHPQTETDLMYGLCDKPSAIEGCNETVSAACEKTETKLCYTDTSGMANCTKECSDGAKDELSCSESGAYLLTDKCEAVAGKKMFVTSSEKCTTKCDDSGDAPVCK